MKRLWVIIFVLINTAWGQKVAITVDGEVVILYKDGAWRTYDEDSLTIGQLKGFLKQADKVVETKGPSVNDIKRALKEAGKVETKSPSVNDFKIISAYSEWDDGRFRILGEIKNNGKIAAGVEVEAIARDKNGILIDSKDFWPNGVSNIPPGGTSGIGFTITNNKRAEIMTIKVISVTVWK